MIKFIKIDGTIYLIEDLYNRLKEHAHESMTHKRLATRISVERRSGRDITTQEQIIELMKLPLNYKKSSKNRENKSKNKTKNHKIKIASRIQEAAKPSYGIAIDFKPEFLWKPTSLSNN